MNLGLKIPFQIMFISALFLLTQWSFYGVVVNDDTPLLISAAESVFGGISTYVPYFEEKPKLFPLLTTAGTIYPTAVLGQVLGDVEDAMLFINIIYYFVAVIFFYNLAALLFKGNGLSILATLFFSANFFILHSGPLALSTDMGGWMMYVIAVYFAVHFFLSDNEKYALWSGFATALGVLFKESGAVGGVVLFLLILFSQRAISAKFVLMLKSFSFLLIDLVYHIWVYLSDGYTYFTRYVNVAEEYYVQRNLRTFITGMGSLFFIGWIPVLYGFYDQIKRRSSDIRNRKPEAFVYISMMVASTSFVVYPAFEPRIYAIAIPFLALFAVHGIHLVNRRWFTLGVVSLYVLTNIYMPKIMLII